MLFWWHRQGVRLFFFLDFCMVRRFATPWYLTQNVRTGGNPWEMSFSKYGWFAYTLSINYSDIDGQYANQNYRGHKNSFPSLYSICSILAESLHVSWLRSTLKWSAQYSLYGNVLHLNTKVLHFFYYFDVLFPWTVGLKSSCNIPNLHKSLKDIFTLAME